MFSVPSWFCWLKGIQILSAAAIAGLEVDVKPFEFGVTNKSPEFLDKFPLGKIPAFEGNDGFALTEGASIARYGQCLDFTACYIEQHLLFTILSLVASLAPESGLLGDSLKDAALVDQWIHFVEHEISTNTSLIAQLISDNFPQMTYSENVSCPLYMGTQRLTSGIHRFIRLYLSANSVHSSSSSNTSTRANSSSLTRLAWRTSFWLLRHSALAA
jgi:hypothetical protein